MKYFCLSPVIGGHETLSRVKSARFAFIVCIAVLLLAPACSQKKNTVVSRGYHNMTSRYNGYFYAKESMKDGLSKLNDSYEDDYTEILPLFRIPNSTSTKGCYPDMEKVIKKSSTVIERHAITDRGGTEIAGAVKWIDDNYQLIGRARYYKGEYLSALQTFEYVSRKYQKFPIRYEGYLWQAKTHLELGGFSQASPLLDLIDNDKACPPELKGDIKATYADLYMREGNYPLAIKNLVQAIDLTKKKKEKVRFLYVLGQLYQKTGDNKKAAECFTKVISLHPEYDMLFNAKINSAQMNGSDPRLRELARRDLNKLLKDPKNREYNDQIYYSLGAIEQQAKHEDLALKFYELSTASSMGNARQKALSYLAAADIFFNRTDYTNAQLYYDSTMQVLPKTYSSYNAVDEKRKSLNNLVKYIKLIQLEDSLQKVVNTYGSDTTKLYPYIDKLIEHQKELDKKAMQQQQLKSEQGGTFQSFQGGSGQGGGNNQNSGSTWYWYNPSTVSSGLNDFLRKWGNRKLEDNWRRSNKETILDAGDGGDGGDDTASSASTKDKPKVAPNKTREYYIKNLPMTQELMDKSNEKIADAYYNLGSIYKEQLRNTPKSINAFEKLTERFPKHKYALPSYYYLYKLYTEQSNKPKADFYRDLILKDYPESEIAQILKNPNYEVNLNADKGRVTEYYTQTYEMFSGGKYTEVIARCDHADSTFGKNDYASRFDYMRALSIGHTQDVQAFAKALTQIVVKHPKDAVKDQAQAILDKINGKNNGGGKDTVATAPMYKVTETTEYQFMVVVDNNKGNINKFRGALSNYNAENYGSANLSVNSMLLDPNHQLVLVKPFTTRTLALDYYNLVKSNTKVFNDLQPGGYQVFAISTENFAILFKDKDVAAYKLFFEQNVIKKTP